MEKEVMTEKDRWILVGKIAIAIGSAILGYFGLSS